MEDVHWIDPTTMEFLTLLVDQVPTVRLFVLLTARFPFRPPWPPHSHVTPIVLTRLTRRQAGEMVARVAGSKALPPDVVAQIVAKTDGVPLYVEELTKMVLESGFVRAPEERPRARRSARRGLPFRPRCRTRSRHAWIGSPAQRSLPSCARRWVASSPTRS